MAGIVLCTFLTDFSPECRIKDYGNLHFDVFPRGNLFNKMKNSRSDGKVNKILAGLVEDVKRNEKISLVLEILHELKKVKL